MILFESNDILHCERKRENVLLRFEFELTRASASKSRALKLSLPTGPSTPFRPLPYPKHHASGQNLNYHFEGYRKLCKYRRQLFLFYFFSSFIFLQFFLSPSSFFYLQALQQSYRCHPLAIVEQDCQPLK
jgi:hypothetical protein